MDNLFNGHIKIICVNSRRRRHHIFFFWLSFYLSSFTVIVFIVIFSVISFGYEWLCRVFLKCLCVNWFFRIFSKLGLIESLIRVFTLTDGVAAQTARFLWVEACTLSFFYVRITSDCVFRIELELMCRLLQIIFIFTISSHILDI